MEKKTYITQCSRCGRSYGSKVTTNGAAPSRTPSSMSGKCPCLLYTSDAADE